MVCDELILERENEVRRFSYLCRIRSFLNNTSDFRNLIGFSSFNLIEQRILHVRQLRKQKKRFIALLLIGLIGIQILGITALTTDASLVLQAKLGNWLEASQFTEVTNSYKEIAEDK